MNASTHRLVVLIVGGALLLSLAGIIACAIAEKDAPKVLELATGSALTGLLGLVASPKGDTVRIDQPAGDPVPVRDAGHFQVETVLIAAAVAIVVVTVYALFVR